MEGKEKRYCAQVSLYFEYVGYGSFAFLVLSKLITVSFYVINYLHCNQSKRQYPVVVILTLEWESIAKSTTPGMLVDLAHTVYMYL